MSCNRQDRAAEPPQVEAGQTIDRESLLIYVPAQRPAGKPVPLVLALSPSGDAPAMIRAWQTVADQRGWIVAASKAFRNGIDYKPVFETIVTQLDELERTYAVEENRVAITGLSGGAMAAHAFARFYPGRVRAIIANTGMMEESFMTAEYPRAMLAVFLASPTDFRYAEMKRDRAFLDSAGWSTTWIEFAGGHKLAPPAANEQAAAWLVEHW